MMMNLLLAESQSLVETADRDRGLASHHRAELVSRERRWRRRARARAVQR
jgi:hypothetical protein